MIHPLDPAITDLREITIDVPRLAKGRGYKGPEFYGCYNTGMAPCIFHSRTGKYVVGPELRCRDAMRAALTLQNKRCHGEGRQRVWIFKGRKAAVAKFTALCIAQTRENDTMRREHAATLEKARRGDMAAALALGTSNMATATVNRTVRDYVQLRQEAKQHFDAGRYGECQIALNVAGQYWRGMVPRERQEAAKLLGIRP